MHKTAFGWIHTYEDYLNIFTLKEEDLKKRIIVYPSGVSNFTAKCFKQNLNTIIAGDEYYQLTPMQLDKYVNERLSRLKQKLEEIGVPAADKKTIYNKAKQASAEFRKDYPQGKLAGRYQAMELPQLPVKDNSFDIALCPRCPLQHRDKNHHKALDIITELCRVAHDVRVFISLSDEESFKHSLGPLLVQLQSQEAFVTLNDIEIATPNTHTAMLRITQRTCNIEPQQQAAAS